MATVVTVVKPGSTTASRRRVGEGRQIRDLQHDHSHDNAGSLSKQDTAKRKEMPAHENKLQGLGSGNRFSTILPSFYHAHNPRFCQGRIASFGIPSAQLEMDGTGLLDTWQLSTRVRFNSPAEIPQQCRPRRIYFFLPL